MPNPGKILYPSGETSALLLAQPCSWPILSNPIDRLSDQLVLEQNFKQWGNAFVPLPLNTPYTSIENFATADQWDDYSDFVLVKESPRGNPIGGFVEWTRTFAKVPPPHTLPTQVQYTFPRLITATNPREVFTELVNATLQFDYVLLDPDQSPADVAPPYPYTPFYIYNFTDPSDQSMVVQFLTDPGNLSGLTVPTASVPTVQSPVPYRQMIANKTQLVAVPPQPVMWMGNILCWQTTFVTAK